MSYRSANDAKATDSSGLPVYGMDLELAERRKPDQGRMQEACDFINAITGEKVKPETFQEDLKSGLILCDMINKISAGSVKKVHKMKIAYMQMENIASYTSACRALKVPEADLFTPVDLFEGKGLIQVVQNIHSLGRVVQSLPGYSGPRLGPKVATKNQRNFSEEQLKGGNAVIPLMEKMQAEAGASAKPKGSVDIRGVVLTKDIGDTSTPSKISMGSHGCASQAGMAKESIRHEVVKMRPENAASSLHGGAAAHPPASKPEVAEAATPADSEEAQTQAVTEDLAAVSVSEESKAEPEAPEDAVDVTDLSGDWYYLLPSKAEKGPVTADALKVIYSNEFITEETHVMHEKLKSWTQISKLESLKKFLQA